MDMFSRFLNPNRKARVTQQLQTPVAHLLCPLSRKVLEQPIICRCDGCLVTTAPAPTVPIFDAAEASKWVEDHGACPATGKSLATDGKESNLVALSDVDASSSNVDGGDIAAKIAAAREDNSRSELAEAMQAWLRVLDDYREDPQTTTTPSPPRDYMCAHGKIIMLDPVKAADGRVYERRIFVEEVARQRREATTRGDSPSSTFLPSFFGEALENDFIEPQHDLRDLIKDWLVRLVKDKGSPPLQPPPSPPTPQPSPPRPTQTSSVQQLNEIFEALEDVAENIQDLVKGFQYPRVVVVGDESAGKSTLLERIFMLPLFPTGRDTCTRMPIKVDVRHSKGDIHCNDDGSSENKHDDVSMLLSLWNTQTNEYLQRPTSVSIEEVRNRVLELMTTNEKLLHLEVRVEVFSPKLPPMSILDLPGLRKGDIDGGDDIETLVRAKIREHKGHAVFVCVHKAGERIENCIAVKILTEELTKEGVRDKTVGALTQVDKVTDDEDLEFNVHKVLRDKPVFEHGWFATSNKDVKGSEAGSDDEDDSEDGKPGTAGLLASEQIKRLDRRARAEPRRLEIAGLTTDKLLSDRAGSDKLVDKILSIYVSHMTETFIPNTKLMLFQERKKKQDAIARLGSPISPGNLTEGDPKLKELQEEARKAVEHAVMPCSNRAKGDIANKVISKLDSELDKLGMDTKHVVEWNGGAEDLLEKFKQDILEACSNIGEHASELWEQAVRNALVAECGDATKDRPFGLKRFPEFQELIVEACHDVGPRLNERWSKDLSSYLEDTLRVDSRDVRIKELDNDEGNNKTRLCTGGPSGANHGLAPKFTLALNRKRDITNKVLYKLGKHFEPPENAALKKAMEGVVAVNFSPHKQEIEQTFQLRETLTKEINRINDAKEVADRLINKFAAVRYRRSSDSPAAPLRQATDASSNSQDKVQVDGEGDAVDVCELHEEGVPVSSSLQPLLPLSPPRVSSSPSSPPQLSEEEFSLPAHQGPARVQVPPAQRKPPMLPGLHSDLGEAAVRSDHQVLTLPRCTQQGAGDAHDTAWGGAHSVRGHLPEHLPKRLERETAHKCSKLFGSGDRAEADQHLRLVESTPSTVKVERSETAAINGSTGIIRGSPLAYSDSNYCDLTMDESE